VKRPRSPNTIANSVERSFANERVSPPRGDPLYYRCREMLLADRGMKISESDWNVFLGHAAAKFKVPEPEQRDVVAFVQSLKNDIVE